MPSNGTLDNKKYLQILTWWKQRKYTLNLLETLNYLLEVRSRFPNPKIESVTIRELNKVFKPECCTTIKVLIISWRAKKENLGDSGSSNGAKPNGDSFSLQLGCMATPTPVSFFAEVGNIFVSLLLWVYFFSTSFWKIKSISAT